MRNPCRRGRGESHKIKALTDFCIAT